MPSTIKLADYLFTRLRQLGVGAVHGVPGDYNLTLLDYVEPSGLLWVGNANELNAGYAADGYARIKGIGAIITTFGVGELSAINAIAGAYTERAAVVHIVGTPPRSSQDGRLKIHHTFNDGEYRRFGQMAALVTVAQTSLRDPRTSPAQIDEVLLQCLTHSRPVYIEVPVDLVDVPVLATSLETPIKSLETIPNPAYDTALKEVMTRIEAAQQPIILVDGEARAIDVLEEVEQLVKSTGWPTWTSGFGKGLVDETLPNVHGIYRGRFGAATIKDFFDKSDLILWFGPHPSTTNSNQNASLPPAQSTISFRDTEIQSGDKIFRDIPAKFAIQQLLQQLDAAKVKPYKKYPDLPKEDSLVSFSEVPKEKPLAQDRVWRALGNFIRPGDIVLAETGTASYGFREVPLPPKTRFFCAVTWLSIGYMLPAAQGAALAQRELISSNKYHGITDAEGGPRTVLIIGDGSFQMTVQELGTIINNNLNVVLFLINNDGYTIERCIHGLHEKYNDVARWQYQRAPEFFGAQGENAETWEAKTYGDLENVLNNEKVKDGKGLRMVEVFLDKEDAPEGPLMELMRRQQVANGVKS